MSGEGSSLGAAGVNKSIEVRSKRSGGQRRDNSEGWRAKELEDMCTLLITISINTSSVWKSVSINTFCGENEKRSQKNAGQRFTYVNTYYYSVIC